MAKWYAFGVGAVCLASAFGCGDSGTGTTGTTTTGTSGSGGASGCPSGLVDCGGVCTNTDTDNAACGACDAPCGAGQVCDGSGQCALSCQAGLTECAGTCTNTATDNAHCGGCSAPCGLGEVCDGSGTCGLSCQVGLTNCGGVCTDTDTSNAHCGACTAPCDPGESCNGSGVCALSCQAGLIDCGGVCTDTDTSNAHCGGCTAPCDPGEVCNGSGVCALSCQAGLIDCGGVCTDTDFDPAHCGACNDPCTAVESCVSGGCVPLGYPTSCLDRLQQYPGTTSGLYLIDPDGLVGLPAFFAYCDMVTDGGGWTLILNRNVNSDNLGQPNINAPLGVFDNTRATNWVLDIDLFWAATTQVVFAQKENADCPNCAISGYDSAIRIDRPAGASWSPACTTVSTAVNSLKLVGTSAGTAGTSFTCGTTLGWGACGSNLCHYGVHATNTSNDGFWSQNAYNEMHFPSVNSSYKSYGDFAVEPSAWCRTCGGGLPAIVNQSSTCCNDSSFNAKSRWTLWVR